MAAQLEEQQEKLRRAVDEWRSRSRVLLADLRELPFAADSGISSSPPAPIRIHVEPIEHSDLSSLLESDNVAVSKFLTVLSYDCIEISRLHKSAKRNLYKQLLFFGHRSSPQQVLLEGEPQKAFGNSLPLFVNLYETTSRMGEILGNLVQQLNSIYSSHDKNVRPLNSFKNFALGTAFSSLGEGLSMFVILDEILKQNSNIRSYLSLFARMLNNAKMGADSFGVSVDDLDFLDRVVRQLERLLDVGLLQRWMQGSSSRNANRKFIEACNSCICDGLSEILARLDSWKEYPFDRKRILHYVALFIFSASSEAPDRKTGKLIAEMLQILPVIYIEGGMRILLIDILQNQCPRPLLSWPPLREASRDCNVAKNNYLMHLNEMHSRDWPAIRGAVTCWVASFQSVIHPSSEISSEACLRLHLRQIVQGMLLANRIHVLVLGMIDLHALLGVPIKREKMRSLCHMVVSLKVLGNMFQIKGLEIIRSLRHILNVVQTDIEQFILPSKAKLLAEVAKGSQSSRLGILSSFSRGGGADTDTRLHDSLSLVLISLQLLQGGGSSKRQLSLSIVLDVLRSIGHLDIDFRKVRKRVFKLAMVADFQSIVEDVTDCGFLYWRKEMLESWFSMIYMDVARFSWVQHLLDAFSDGLWLLKQGRVGEHTLQSYEKEVESALRNEIIAPLCRDVETDLRLHVHSAHLKGSVHVNPTKTGVRNLSWYLQMKPLKLPFRLIDVRLLVESYLNSAFYNHTAMSSNDWKMYSEMRQLAELKYGLTLDDIHLAEHSVSFDVNEVAQNLQTFLEKYSYDIVKQIFIEKPFNRAGKNLRFIDVELVASSIATHGQRIVSTASNSVLRYLSHKFATLCDSLKDKDVRSQLLQESNLWKSEKGKIMVHPFVQQGELNDVIRKFTLADRGASFLDELHSIVTKMGNALGLLRILLAGSSHCSCTTSRFISRPSNKMSFMEGCQKVGFSDAVVEAGRVMDIAIESRYRSADHTESFCSIINSFSEELQSNRYHKPEDFFLIIPPLVVNMVESKVHHKDKTLRRDHDSGNVVNAYDGFIFGAAYVLKVTGQEKSFDELDWFGSSKRNLAEALISLEGSGKNHEQRKGSSLGLKRWSQSPSVSSEAQKAIDKHRRYLKEIELVECCLNVARTIMA